MRNQQYATTTLPSFATETEGLNQEFSPMYREEYHIVSSPPARQEAVFRIKSI